jgi:hypothetical protein
VQAGECDFTGLSGLDWPAFAKHLDDDGWFHDVITVAARALIGDDVAFITVVDVEHGRLECFLELIAGQVGEILGVGGEEAGP